MADSVSPKEFDIGLHERVPDGEWEIVDVQFPSTTHTDIQIPHGLNPPTPEDIEYTVLRQATPGTVYEDRTASRTNWQRGFIVLRSDTADWTGRLLLRVLKTPQKWNPGQQVVYTPPAAPSYALNDLTDVTITAPTTGETLRYSGSAWVDQKLAMSDLSSYALDDLSDVAITGAASGDILRHNGSNWVDLAVAAIRAEGTLGTPIVSKTDNYTATTSDTGIPFFISSAKTLTLYAASGNGGRVLYAANYTSSGGTLTIDGNASETIDGQTTIDLLPGEGVFLFCDGNGWTSWADKRMGRIFTQYSVGTYASSTTTTSSTYVDSNLEVTHTPKHASNLLVIHVHVPIRLTSITTTGMWELHDGTTQHRELQHYTHGDDPIMLGWTHVMAAGTTSAVTWKVRFKRTAGAGTCETFYANKIGSITVLEFGNSR